MKLLRKFQDGAFLKKFHGWMTIIWLILAVPSIIWWHSSLLWLVLMSVYACFIGHFSSWQASRAEQNGKK